MKKRNKSKSATFFRAFSLTAVFVLLPCLLIYGIMVADNRTRDIGFVDAEPAVSVVQDDDGVKIGVLGYDMEIDQVYIDAAKNAADFIESTTPADLRMYLFVFKAAKEADGLIG